VQIHIPRYVKEEFLSQQIQALTKEIEAIKASAKAIVRKFGNTQLTEYSEGATAGAEEIGQRTQQLAADDFQQWIKETHAIEHSVKPMHGVRVTDAYFSGSHPFRAPKHRDDIPDSFIWQTALDLAAEYGSIDFVAADGLLYKAADAHSQMIAHGTLDDFIQTDECQDALYDLTPEVVSENINRIKALLPGQTDDLLRILGERLLSALPGKTVRHPAIPEDNNEATIFMVGEPQQTEFDFAEIESYGDGDLGISFTANVDCTLNYTIYKGDYYSLPDTDDISIDEWSDHYYSAEQEYSLTAEGALSISIDTADLQSDDFSDDNLRQFIRDASYDIEVDNVKVNVPFW
jgi:hypothetical protein